jgi:hypothetical protein
METTDTVFPEFQPGILEAKRRVDRWLTPLCGLAALAFYLALLPSYLPCGAPAELAAATLGLPSHIPPFHLLWRLQAALAAAIPVGTIAQRLAVAGALDQAVAAALLYRLTVELLMHRLIPNGTRVDALKVRAIHVGGVVAAMAYATSTPAVLTGTRASMHALDVLLLAGALLAFIEYLDSSRVASLLLAATIGGFGMAECSACVPAFAVMTIWGVVGLWHQNKSSLPVLAFAGAGLLIAALVYPGVCYVLGIPGGAPHVLLLTHWSEWMQDYSSRTGMLLGVLALFPLILMLATLQQTLNYAEEHESLLINFALAAGAVFVLTSAFPSFRLYVLASPQAPVLPACLAAITAGLSAGAWWAVAFSPAESEPAVDDTDRHHGSTPPVVKGFGYGVAIVLSAAILFSAGLSVAWLRARPDWYSQRCAESMLRELGPRDWVFGATPADTHLLVLSRERGTDLHVLPLAANRRWPAVQARVQHALAADPVFAGADRPRLAAAAALGPDAFLRAWLLADPAAAAHCAVAGLARVWESCGFSAAPGVFFFTAAAPGAPPPASRAAVEQMAARARAARFHDAVQTLALSTAAQILGETLAAAAAREGRPATAAEIAAAADWQVRTPGGEARRRLYAAPLAWIWEAAVPEGRPEHRDIQHVLRQAQSLSVAEADDEDRRAAPRLSDTANWLRLAARASAPYALYALSRDSADQARVDEAFSWLGRLDQTGAWDDELLPLRAIGYLAVTGGVEQASLLLRRAVALQPRDLWSWHLLAVARLQRGDAAAVAREILPAMERAAAPGNDYARLTRALLAYAAGGTNDLRRSRDLFAAVADSHPDFLIAREWALRLDGVLHDEAAVARDASHLIAHDVFHPQANYALALLAIQAMRPAEAERLLSNSLSGAITPHAVIARARLCFQRRMFADALQLARKATSEYPSYVEGWRVLADVLERTGKQGEAEVVRTHVQELLGAPPAQP